MRALNPIEQSIYAAVFAAVWLETQQRDLRSGNGSATERVVKSAEWAWSATKEIHDVLNDPEQEELREYWPETNQRDTEGT